MNSLKTLLWIISIVNMTSICTLRPNALKNSVNITGVNTIYAKHVKKPKTKTVRVLVTAYCPCKSCSGNWGTMTATGKKARPKHTIAVDPKVFPYGTKIKIGKHWYVAEDCGGMINGKHIDIFMKNHKQVQKFGKKHLRVKVRYKR